MKLLIDMNLWPRWLDVREAAGFEARHWSDVGSLDATDVEVMSFASDGDVVVLTDDLDFGALLALTKGAKPSVDQLRADEVPPEATASVVVGALAEATAERDRRALRTINTARAGLSLLPLVRT